MGIQQMIMAGGPYGVSDPPAASGGTVVESPGWRMHVFTEPGTLTINNPTNFSMKIATFGGGGGGGCDSYNDNRGAGGGGGGGWNNPSADRALVAGTTYTVQVGAGGPGPVNSPASSVTNNPYAKGPTSDPFNVNGGQGGCSRFGAGTPFDQQAGGGGGGGAHNAYPGPFDGGSAAIYNQGTGASETPTAPVYPTTPNLQCPTDEYGSGGGGVNGQSGGAGGPRGNNGGQGAPYSEGTGGGGGGADAVGSDGPSPLIGGAGGAGKALSTVPVPIAIDMLDPINVGHNGYFCGGGGGKGSSSGGAGGLGGGGAGWTAGPNSTGPTNGAPGGGTNGSTNTGGGGGGSRLSTGGAGGSGVVICYYPY